MKFYSRSASQFVAGCSQQVCQGCQRGEEFRFISRGHGSEVNPECSKLSVIQQKSQTRARDLCDKFKHADW
jgi:hypothetical protein